MERVYASFIKNRLKIVYYQVNMESYHTCERSRNSICKKHITFFNKIKIVC